MSILTSLFGKKVPTSAAIAAEIDRARFDYDAAIAKRDAALASIATMTDDEHRAAEEGMEARRRAAERARARIAELEKAHANALAAEAEAARVDAAEALRKRAEASRQANDAGAAKLLAEYDEHAERLADVLGRFAALDAERDAVNEALRANPVADAVKGYNELHRKHPDRLATEQREMRDTWIYSDGTEAPVIKSASGANMAADPVWDFQRQRWATSRIEQREVVLGRTRFRQGRHEASLSAIHLPPGFAGGRVHHPRG